MSSELTPLMTQYWEIKKQAPDCLLFFRMGDFYELFYEDAKTAAPLLEIALTSRNKTSPDPVAMCGVPHHSATNYINKLVRLGHRVAICDQLEDPSAAKGIVKRGITSIVTPGTQLDPDALDSSLPLLTHAIRFSKDEIHWASCDYSTGFTCFGVLDFQKWKEYFYTQNIQEILCLEDEKTQLEELLPKVELGDSARQPLLRYLNNFYFDPATGEKRLKEQFEVHHLSALEENLPKLPLVCGALGALIRYFQDCRNDQPIPLTSSLLCWRAEDFLEMGATTINALELFSEQGLFHHLNHAKTAVGARLLRERIQYPLVDKPLIEDRLDDLEFFISLNADSQISPLRNGLSEVFDFERILTRIKLRTCSPRELRNLATSLLNASQVILALKAVLPPVGLGWLRHFEFSASLQALAQRVVEGFQAELPINAREGGIFTLGFDKEVDEYINLSDTGAQWLADFEAKERASTGISSLKVRFNRVFGYYIEITKTNLHLAPLNYVRKQTTSTGERFITEELKVFEDKILNAHKRRQELELRLFLELCETICVEKKHILEISQVVAQIDVLQSLTHVCQGTGARSRTRKFVRPEISNSCELEILEGRHPVLDRQPGFVPNSITFGRENTPFLLITGPNMGGKSTAMRQTALIVLLAQMGCFVPAASAKIGICDRIFTRIGANDKISQGMSTFMVEMTEMSSILNQASEKSLILVDEIGRGTSTYDGLSLAWAIAERILNTVSARTLFATHYHELTQLADQHRAAANMRVGVSVKDEDGHEKIQFLYKLEPGAAQRSYGIYVAKLAGVPPEVIARAQELLDQFSAKSYAVVSEPIQIKLNKAHVELRKTKRRTSRSQDFSNPDLRNQLQFGFQEISPEMSQEISQDISH